MSLELLLGQWDQVIQTPDDINRLNATILQWAVQGKLVPQCVDDEPASIMLEQIKGGEFKKNNQLPAINETALPFALPTGWAWMRLGEIIQVSSGKNLTSKQMVQDGGIPVYGGNGITGYHNDFNVTKPTIVIGRVGFYCGSVHLTEPQAWVTDNAFITGFPDKVIDRDYLIWLLRGTDLKKDDNATAQPVISGRKIYPIVVGLPPLEEQKRIVIVLEDLLTQTKALVVQMEKAQAQQRRVHQAVVHQLTRPHITPAWQIITRQFDTLYQHPDNIAELKQTILQLAVQGRLVPQDERDEINSQFLEKIQKERFTFTLSREDKEEIINEIEYLKAEVHSGNRKIQISARCICDFITKGTTPSKSEFSKNGEIPYLKVYNIRDNKIDFEYNPIFISRNVHQTQLARSKVYPGDILMNIVGPPLGKVAIVPFDYPEWNINQALAVFRPVPSYNRQFIHLALTTFSTLETVLNDTRGTAGQDNLSLGQCRNIKLPLFTLAHQEKIMAKASELLALCDQLTTQTNTSAAARGRLRDALLAG